MTLFFCGSYKFNICYNINMKYEDYVPILAYFDIFDYPLTRQEVEKWAVSKKIAQKLLNLPSLNSALADGFSRAVEVKDGFFFLKGRKELVEIRKQRYLVADKKFRRALFFAKLFRLLPSVRLIAVCNTLAFSNAKEESDIDFFIITKPGTIWLTRFWLQSALALLGVRPSDNASSNQDSLCLSFFITADSLSLEKIKLDDEDIYLPLWISWLVPIYDPDNLSEKLWHENSWIRNFLPNAYRFRPAPQLIIKKTNWSFLFSVFTWPVWEVVLKKWQYKLFSSKIKKMANRDRRVVINDKMLKFHTNDRLSDFKKIWLEKLKQLI